jgi:hypothetical protein
MRPAETRCSKLRLPASSSTMDARVVFPRGAFSVPRKKAQELRLLEALSALPVQQVAQRPDVNANIVLRLIDDALISKVCASYLRDIIDADAEVRADCGEHGPIHQFWSGVMEGPTAR